MKEKKFLSLLGLSILIGLIVLINLVNGLDCTSLNNADWYVSFDESTALDLSGNGRNPSVINADYVTSGCKLRNCYSFNITKLQYITYGDFGAGVKKQFMSFWVYKVGHFGGDSSEFIITKSGGSYAYVVAIWAEKNYSDYENAFGYLYTQQDSPYTFVSRTVNNASIFGEWQHIIAYHNGTHQKIYIDGILVINENNIIPSYLADDGSIWQLGRMWSGGTFLYTYTGLIDEIYYKYDSDLNDDDCQLNTTCGGDIAKLYNSGLGCNPYYEASPEASLYLNTTLQTGNYNQNFNFSFNGTVINTNFNNFDCSISYNNSIYYLIYPSDIRENINVYLDYGNLEIGYDINISCSNNNATSERIIYDVLIDNSRPIITTDFLNNSLFYNNTNIIYHFNITDKYLFKVNHSIIDFNTKEILREDYLKNITIGNVLLNISNSTQKLGLGYFEISIYAEDYLNNSIIENYYFNITAPIPVIENFYTDINNSLTKLNLNMGDISGGISMLPYIIGFIAFFILGLFTYRFLISISALFTMLLFMMFTKMFQLNPDNIYYKYVAIVFLVFSILVFILGAVLGIMQSFSSKPKENFYKDY